jgi:EmrB/QacA subfamily drug resistance transporter
MAGPATAHSTHGSSTTERRTVLIVSAGVFMANLDLFIVNLAIPSIRAELAATDLTRLSWVLTAYAAVFAGFLVPLGRWADRIGRRRGYVIGLILFTGASALAAAASSVELLIAARGLQALGAALVVPTSLSLLLAAVPAARRSAAIGGWAAASAVAAASGPVIGGVLVEFSWRWVFLINLPIGIGAAVLAVRHLPETREQQQSQRPDLLGAVALTGATALLALGLVEGGEWGWTSLSTATVLGGAAVLGGLFARRSASHTCPVVERALLVRPFVMANVASLVFYAAFAAMLLLLVLLLSDRWGYSPLQAGLAIAPGPLVVFAVARRLTPRLIGNWGAARTAGTGALLFAGGYALWALTWGEQPAYAAQVLPGLLLTGLGVGLVMPSTIVAGTASLPPVRFATGSAVLTMSRQLGAVAGTAGLVTVLGPAPRLEELRTALLVFAVVSLAVALPARGLNAGAAG